MPPPQQGNCFIRVEGGAGISALVSNIIGNNSVGDTLIFNSMPPDLGSTKNANINHTQILGRSETIKTYASSGTRAWNLELQFFAENDARKDVVHKINWCESLVYPIYIRGLSHGLPILTFVFGNYLNVRVICSDVTTHLPGPWGLVNPITEKPSLGFANFETYDSVDVPLYGMINLTLIQLGDTSFGHFDVRDGLHNNTGGNR